MKRSGPEKSEQLQQKRYGARRLGQVDHLQLQRLHQPPAPLSSRGSRWGRDGRGGHDLGCATVTPCWARRHRHGHSSGLGGWRRDSRLLLQLQLSVLLLLPVMHCRGVAVLGVEAQDGAGVRGGQQAQHRHIERQHVAALRITGLEELPPRRDARLLEEPVEQPLQPGFLPAQQL